MQFWNWLPRGRSQEHPSASCAPDNWASLEGSLDALATFNSRLERLSERLEKLADLAESDAWGAVPVSIPGVGLFEFCLHDKPDIWISDVIRRGDIFDWQVLETLKALLKLGGVFLDVGANIGWFTAIGSRLVGDSGAVIAVEPDPDNLVLLKRNVIRNKSSNVSILPAAAGAQPGVAMLTRSKDNQGDHRLEVTTDRTESVQVPVRRLDDFLGADALPRRVDVVKIDTQGSETVVLRGLERTLADSGAARVILEFWPYGLRQCGSSATELVAWLAESDRRLWRIGADASALPVSADDLLALSEGELHPDGQGFIDLVAMSPTDVDGLAIMAARQRGS